MAYELRLYYNTGLNPSNVPDSPAVIQQAQSGIFEGIPIMQNRYIGSITIAVTDFNSIKNVDYAQIGDEFYFINSVVMENPTTATLNLQYDFIGSVGINNIIVLGGWTSRRHYTTAEDVFGANTLDEPFAPAEPPVMEFQENIFDIGGTTKKLVLSTVKLGSVSDTAKKYVTSDNESVVVPSLQPILRGSYVEMQTLNGNEVYTLPGMQIYNFDEETTQNGIADIRSLGVESAIMGSYSVPDSLTTIVPGPTLSGEGVAGVASITKAATADYNAMYGTVENKKALALYNSVFLTNISSGATAEYKATDITTTGNLNFIVWADLSPTGATYARPTSYKGNTTDSWTGAVKGGNWQNNQINFTTGSGFALSSKNFQMNYAQQSENLTANREYMTSMYNLNNNWAVQGANVAGRLIGQAGNIGKQNYGAVAGTALSDMVQLYTAPEAAAMTYNYNYVSAGREFNQALARNKQAFNNEWLNISTIYPYGASLQSYYNNDFNITATHLSTGDLQRFDEFLHLYGYAVSEPFKAAFLRNKPNYNFIQTSGAIVKTSRGALYNSAVADILDSGVRIWHNLPTAAALQIGGN